MEGKASNTIARAYVRWLSIHEATKIYSSKGLSAGSETKEKESVGGKQINDFTEYALYFSKRQTF